MPSQKFLELVGFLYSAEQGRPKVNKFIALKPYVFVWIWTASLALTLAAAWLFFNFTVQTELEWLGGFGAYIFLLVVAWSPWSGPFGLEQRIGAEERAVRFGYRDTRTRLPDLPLSESVIVFGLGPISSDVPLHLTSDPIFLNTEMLERTVIGEDLRLNLGPYEHLGVAYWSKDTPASIAHETMQRYPWHRLALANGKSDHEIANFVRAMDPQAQG